MLPLGWIGVLHLYLSYDEWIRRDGEREEGALFILRARFLISHLHILTSLASFSLSLSLSLLSRSLKTHLG